MPRKKTVRKPKAATNVSKSRNTSTKKKTSSAKTTSHRQRKQPNRLSALEAAIRVLQRCDTPMNCRELIETMAAKNYWKSSHGKTPERTLYAAIHREIRQKGEQSRFRQVQRGRFATTRAAKK